MGCLVVEEDFKLWRDIKEEGINSTGLRVGVGHEDVYPLGSRVSQELVSIKVDQRGDAIQQWGMAGQNRCREGGEEIQLPRSLEVE